MLIGFHVSCLSKSLKAFISGSLDMTCLVTFANILFEFLDATFENVLLIAL